MRADEQIFAAKVELPCQVFCGPEFVLQIPGTVLSIDTGNLVVIFGRDVGFLPVVGERVKLETMLPGNAEYPRTRCLSCRARVTKMTELADGNIQTELSFRKASFRDFSQKGRRNPVKAASAPAWTN